MIKRIFVLIVVIMYSFFGRAQQLNGIEPQLIATGFQFAEGPTWHPNGYLVFSDITANKIFKWSEANGVEEYLNPSGNSNGIACSRKNELFVCRQANRDIAKISTDDVVSAYISTHKSKKFNSPNDVALSYMGSVYFTDPYFGLNSDTLELPYQGLYCVPYNKSEAVLLDSTLIKPNGLTFVNDWRTLYVCESSTNNIYSYALKDEYLLQDIQKDKKLFAHIEGEGEVDGITSDVFGNIFVAFGDGGMRILNSSAIEIGQIIFPAKEKVRNMCFGGKYNNILFVTAGTSLYKLEIRYFGDFIAPGLLGMPTNQSVVFNALSDKATDCYIKYGTTPSNLTLQTKEAHFQAQIPIEITLSELSANTKYYYQLMYKIEGETVFRSATTGSFWTQREKNNNFSFAVEADPHLDEGSNYITFNNMLKNAKTLESDFLIDLGDNFLTEKFPIVDEYYIEQRNLLYRNFWDKVCNSMPLFIAQGNHEGELGWRNENSAESMFNLTNTIRKEYYPIPQPSDFYTGSEIEDPFNGKRENYYAWNWGDALFVVLDPYTYTEEHTNDPWNYTLGKIQYDWFRKTLEESTQKYKFVFAHQIIGGDNIGRGGAEFVDFFEMGGKNNDGSYGFDEKRPGWGKPIHQLMVDNGVQIYFHGHDHFYAEQKKDGIIYQECPQPSFPGYTVANDAEKYGYVSGMILPNSGHLQVSIMNDSAKVEYIGAYHVDIPNKNQINGNIRRTYYIKPNVADPTFLSDEKKSELSIYQVENMIAFESNMPIKGNIQLYSLTGQFIHTFYQGSLDAGKYYFELPEIANQIYIAKLSSEKQMIVTKILKK